MLALLLLTAAIPLTVPMFPSQDGPVHLYYVDVLRAILTHSAPYAQHFQLTRFLTPYSLEYYTLLALEFVFSPIFSEKLLVAAYIFAFGLGFRYLVESVTERGSPWILMGVPFCLHALVYMGFLNFCTAVAILLFECGFWMRYSAQLTGRRAAALLAGLVLLLLTHPVPAAVFLMFAGLYFVADLSCEVWNGARWSAAWRARRVPLAILAAMSLSALAWVSLFLRPGQPGAHEVNHIATMGWFDTVATELQLYPVAAFTRLGDRAGLALVLIFACLAILARIRHWRPRKQPVTLLAASSICFLLYCFAPERVNGSFYFAERFPILWALFLLVGAASIHRRRAWNLAAGGIAMVVTLALFFQQRAKVMRLASEIAAQEQLAPAPPGSVGLIVSQTRLVPDGLEFNPYMWCAVHYFRRSRAILANDPWIDVPLIMLRPAHPGRWSYLDPDSASALLIARTLEGTSARDLDFVVQMGPANGEVDRLLRREGWTLSGQSGGLMRIYRRP
ncbi:MAG TPA: hypothetical protein VHW09_15430 [Bryobacteraceae bacterium]|nr:hypothetical protein [Bryobacteraceae bacterium]